MIGKQTEMNENDAKVKGNTHKMKGKVLKVNEYRLKAIVLPVYRPAITKNRRPESQTKIAFMMIAGEK